MAVVWTVVTEGGGRWTAGSRERDAKQLVEQLNVDFPNERHYVSRLYDDAEVSALRDGLTAARRSADMLRDELARERRRVKQLRRAVLAWAERWHGTDALEYARQADETDNIDVMPRAIAKMRLAMSLQRRARDRSRDDAR